MTRFKELARIQAAIKHKNQPELEWALWYCRMRVRIAARKDHLKHWRALERDVTKVMRELSDAPHS